LTGRPNTADAQFAPLAKCQARTDFTSTATKDLNAAIVGNARFAADAYHRGKSAQPVTVKMSLNLFAKSS
jgi:hypothetical protein